MTKTTLVIGTFTWSGMRSERRKAQIDGVRLALGQREGSRAFAPCLEQVRVPFLPRLQVSHGDRHVPPRRKALNLKPALLIRTRALDEARLRPPLRGIVRKHHDGGVERHAAAVVRHCARDGGQPLSQLNLESIDVGGEVQRCVSDIDTFPPY